MCGAVRPAVGAGRAELLGRVRSCPTGSRGCRGLRAKLRRPAVGVVGACARSCADGCAVLLRPSLLRCGDGSPTTSHAISLSTFQTLNPQWRNCAVCEACPGWRLGELHASCGGGVARVLSRKGCERCAKGAKGVRRVRKACEGCEGCAERFDAGRGLLRVGACGTRACLPRK